MTTDAKLIAVYTIGHSTREWAEFVRYLTAHGIDVIADVRKLPGSRKFPHFNQEAMKQSLAEAGIDYLHFPALGGRRKSVANSPNDAWQNASFRAFADYMLTPEFAAALDDFLTQIGSRRAALMCSEAVPWRCHRNLIADALVVHGVRVEHILSPTRTQTHVLNPSANVTGTRIIYAAR